MILAAGRQAGRSALVAVASVIGLIGVSAVARAQAFGERPLLTDTTVPITIDSRTEFIPSANATTFFQDYGPLLDMRRRIIANPWARSALLLGPAEPGLQLSPDSCEEDPHSATFPGRLPCLVPPATDRDRLEVYWGWNYATPTNTRFGSELNRMGPPARLGLFAPLDGANSMLFPGLFFRFVTGPPPPWLGTPTWTAMAATPEGPPRGEDTGFLIDRVRLFPRVPPARGHDFRWRSRRTSV